MKIADVQFFRFAVPFERPIYAGGRNLKTRQGLILSVTDDQGHIGWGEAAPLAGVNAISVDLCLEELRIARDALKGQTLNWQNFCLSCPAMGLLSENLPPELKELSPVSAFGLESAFVWLGLNAGKWQLPAGRHLEVAVNGLFVPSIDPDAVYKNAENLKIQGFSTLKVKIGRIAAQEEIRQILALDAFFHHQMIFRLDANQSLCVDSYAAYYQALKKIHVEYVEEPLLPELGFFDAARVPWPLALDESMGESIGESIGESRDDFLDRFLDQSSAVSARRKGRVSPALGAIILKPGVLAGVSGMVQAMNRCSRRKIKPVLSSAFNTGIGIAGLAVLAALYGKNTAHGLDTLKYFRNHLFSPDLSFTDGCLRLSEPFFHRRLRFFSDFVESVF